ncbi:hypothetical protein J6590_089412 [Homalodisca vitripennis]|nr:hypothetical protein J6590_089412 [Homalodisca vitripennis]
MVIVLRVHSVGAFQRMKATVNVFQDDVVDFLDVHIHGQEDSTTSTLVWITPDLDCVPAQEVSVMISATRSVNHVLLQQLPESSTGIFF